MCAHLGANYWGSHTPKIAKNAGTGGVTVDRTSTR
jgi:hypothetical protein